MSLFMALGFGGSHLCDPSPNVPGFYITLLAKNVMIKL
jgi:hypothetical protein